MRCFKKTLEQTLVVKLSSLTEETSPNSITKPPLYIVFDTLVRIKHIVLDDETFLLLGLKPQHANSFTHHDLCTRRIFLQKCMHYARTATKLSPAFNRAFTPFAICICATKYREQRLLERQS